MFFIKKFFNIVNTILILICLLLAYVIAKDKLVNNKKINDFFNSFYSFLNLSSKKEQEVSTTIKYYNIDKYIYTNSDFKIYCPSEAIILEKGEDYLILKCFNGYFSYIGNIYDIQGNLFDQLNKNSVIAKFYDSFEFYYYNNNQRFEYYEI